jgi:hypothetical protein
VSLALTQHELDDAKCASPRCDHADCAELYLHSGCHTAKPTWARYAKSRGVLVIVCAECKRVVAEIQVAP